MIVVETSPKAVLEGLAVGPCGKVQCDRCHESVREGDRVGIYAYQMVECPEPTWDLPMLACASCRRSDLGMPTLGATEVWAYARLAVTSDSATQSARLTICDPEIMQISPTANGGAL